MAFGSIAINIARGGDGIPAEIFQILKGDAVNVLPQYASKFKNVSSDHRNGKGQFSFQPKKGQCQRMFKLLGNCDHFTF